MQKTYDVAAPLASLAYRVLEVDLVASSVRRWPNRGLSQCLGVGRLNQLGHIFVRESKTDAGVRQIPLDRTADRALVDYIARGRPNYKGDGPEPLFLTDNGRLFTYWGWTSMARRIGERMHEAGFNGFMQHRARGSTAKLLQRRGVPLNVIQQIGGWEGPEMVRRYIGDYSVEELKTFPTVGLDEILTPDKRQRFSEGVHRQRRRSSRAS